MVHTQECRFELLYPQDEEGDQWLQRDSDYDVITAVDHFLEVQDSEFY